MFPMSLFYTGIKCEYVMREIYLTEREEDEMKVESMVFEEHIAVIVSRVRWRVSAVTDFV